MFVIMARSTDVFVYLRKSMILPSGLGVCKDYMVIDFQMAREGSFKEYA